LNDKPPLDLGGTLADAVQLYKLLFRRTIPVAAAVFGIVMLTQLAHHEASGGMAVVLELCVQVLIWAGPIVIQGAVVELVRNVHEGRTLDDARSVFAVVRARFWALLGASIVYGLGVAIGLLLLILPGLVAGTRWALMAPSVVLEGRGVDASRRRSRELVTGRGIEVFLCLLTVYLAVGLVGLVVVLNSSLLAVTLLVPFVWGTLTAPFEAHVLTVIYYRLADPERPVIHPASPTAAFSIP
jgi:hypothetical protein